MSREWTKDWKQQGIEEGWQEGRQEGLQQGLQQGEAELLLRLLERRFGPVDETVRTRVRSADSQTLVIWGERILVARTIEEIFRG